MRNKIFKIAIMAAVALTLMVGSAFAAEIATGSYLALTGKLHAVCNTPTGNCTDYSKVYAVEFLPVNAVTFEGDEDRYVQFLFAEGSFAERMPNLADWYMSYIPDFPNADIDGEYAWTFRDKDLLTLLSNVDLGVSGVDIGTIEDFTFTFTEIYGFYFDSNQFGDSFGFRATGYVTDARYEYEQTDLVFSFTATASYRTDPWAWTLTAHNPVLPPEVPEPGTLVLLGTGLLGTAIVARRKMNKK